jgi:hypothetical protein
LWFSKGTFTLAKFVTGLALATMGDATKNRNNPNSSVVPPKVVKTSKDHNKLRQCKLVIEFPFMYFSLFILAQSFTSLP